MAASAIERLIGSSQGIVDKLGSLGGSADKASQAWAGLIGPIAARGAPAMPAPPPPSPKSFVPESRGFLGLPVSGSTLAFGGALFALLAYLVARGR